MSTNTKTTIATQSATIALVLLVLCSALRTAEGRSALVHRIEDFDEKVDPEVSSCRSTCLHKFAPFPVSHSGGMSAADLDACTDRPDCFMCWDFCRMLVEEKPTIADAMCSDPTCFAGCKYACVFHDILSLMDIAN